jgi:phosphatidylglycerophosphate synthase
VTKDRSGPLIGLFCQLSLLAVIAGTVGLGLLGWLAGTAVGVVTCVALTRGLHVAGSARLGPADRVTLTRATLVGAVTALTLDPSGRHAPLSVLVLVIALALALDAVDGQVARRTGTVSALGARFDMEVDAFLLLVLSLEVSRSLGAWVLAIGLMRYGYVLATWLAPWMQGTLPPRHWRKVVAAVQGVVLAVAIAGALPRPVLAGAVAGALLLLLESFGHDIVWLWQHRMVSLPRHRAAVLTRAMHETLT